MGVLLSGPKGTGKTVEAKSICVKSNMPIILLTEAFNDCNFLEFFESIKTPSIIFIDEFEKREQDYLKSGGTFIVPCPAFRLVTG
jgi:SpoVK/Ycf46/Vps4 family AAA+-type ATPase